MNKRDKFPTWRASKKKGLQSPPTTVAPDIYPWLFAYQHGALGSKQLMAYEIIQKLIGPEFATCQTEEIRGDYEAALLQIVKAFQEYDSEFLRSLADGIDELKDKAPYYCRQPQLLLAYGYISASAAGKRLPTKARIIARTKLLWAVVRITGVHPAGARFFHCNRQLRKQIAAEIKSLPEQKWTRHFKSLGLSGLPSAKKGPKRRPRARRRPRAN